MTIATSPYCTTTVMVQFLKNVYPGGDLDEVSTIPSKVDGEKAIALMSGWLEHQFRRAGYIIPFQERLNFPWPVSQTVFLELLAIYGSAAMVTGEMVYPAPMGRPGGTDPDANSFFTLWLKGLDTIYRWDYNRGIGRSISGFQAAFYDNTAAAAVMEARSGPITDFDQGYLDPLQSFGLKALGDLMWESKTVFQSLGLKFDYMEEVVMAPLGITLPAGWQEVP